MNFMLPVQATRREARAREALERAGLRAGLAQLPAPRNEYQLMVPEVLLFCLALTAFSCCMFYDAPLLDAHLMVMLLQDTSLLAALGEKRGGSCVSGGQFCMTQNIMQERKRC